MRPSRGRRHRADIGLMRPELYFISGSPPAWRVMLALWAKGVDYAPQRLHTESQDNRTPEYLALNPRGQVPTLVHDGVVVTESVAILAYVERAWRGRPIFGQTDAEAGRNWSLMMDMHSNLLPDAGEVARTLFRKQVGERETALASAAKTVSTELETLAAGLVDHPFFGGARPMAPDIHLYPTLGWLDRALALNTAALPPAVAALVRRPPALADWLGRMRAQPGIEATHPPHWADG